jgi:methionine-gamma-lyase
MTKDRSHSDRIGNHKLHPETLMLGYGYDPALSEGSVKPPIFLTSTPDRPSRLTSTAV